MAKTGKHTALVAIDGGKWHVSFHDSIDDATSYGQSRLKNIEDGWSIETEEHFAEVQDEQLPSLYSFLAPKGATVPDDKSIRAETWALISKDLVPPPAPAAEASDDEPQPEEEDLNTQPEAEAPAKPARTRTPAKAPAKEPAKAAARPAPARAAPAPARAAPARAAARPAAPAKAPAKGGTPLKGIAAKAAAKVAASKAPAKAAAPAKKKAVGEAGVSPAWLAVIAGIAKKGDAGVDSAFIAALCEKNGVKPFYARFVRPVADGGKGYLARVSHGIYKATAAGKKAAGV